VEFVPEIQREGKRITSKRLFFRAFFGCADTFYLPSAALDHITWIVKLPADSELIPTRATLIQRLKDWQDQSSWQDFFDTYWKLIYGVALRSGMNEAEAQDVVQETMMSVAKYMPSFKYDPNIGSFKTWLLNMTRWRITDQLRKRGRFTPYPPPPDDTVTATHPIETVADPAIPDLESRWDAEWEETLYTAAVAHVKRRLDPQKYQIFDFYVNKQWTSEKVAEAFGITVEQVYMAKHRVTEMIRNEVKRIEKEMS